MFRRAALLVILFYQRCVSPLLPGCCRFEPSCSQYAAGVIERYGFFRGALKAVGRLLRCHPFHPGGYDPIP